MEQVAQCSMPTLKSSLSWEQVAEKFEWEVLSKWLKSLSGEWGASGCKVLLWSMEQVAVTCKVCVYGASGYMQ